MKRLTHCLTCVLVATGVLALGLTACKKDSTVKPPVKQSNTVQPTVKPGEDDAPISHFAPAKVAVPTPTVGKDFTIDLGDDVTLEMVWIPGGTFQMGSRLSAQEVLRRYGGKLEYFTHEHPLHTVELDGFWLGKYEVTNAQYRRFRSSHSSGDYGGYSLNGASQPVVEVSWQDAKTFCDWLSRSTGKTYTLPTEAQWEYACRGGTQTVRYWGNDDSSMGQHANVADRTTQRAFSDWTVADTTDGYVVSAPVGRFRANRFGLYDMLGNVCEWCGDWYGEDYYGRSVRRNPTGPGSGKYRVLRGGSWCDDPWLCRSAIRFWRYPGVRSDSFGFRLARTP